MAYDDDLADRIRELLSADARVSERRMFGGLAFFVDGNMAVTASGRGGLMVRVDPAESAALLARSKASRMVMRGREMDGWLLVALADVPTKRQLEPWVRRGVAYAASLPPKSRSKSKSKAPRE